MINYLHCEYPLPIPDDLKEAAADWDKVEFQTGSLLKLGAPLDKYTISEDGQIYRESATRVEITEPEDAGHCPIENFVTPEYGDLERIDGYTGEIRFFGIHMEDKYDHWLEFVALYREGEILGLICTESSKEDNKKRKEAQKKFVKQLKVLDNNRKSIWFSIRSFYVSFIDLISEGIIKFILFIRKLIT